MRIKCHAQGHHCRCQQIRTGDLTIESQWSYPLSHSSLWIDLTKQFHYYDRSSPPPPTILFPNQPAANMALDHDLVRSVVAVGLAADRAAVALVALLVAAVADCVVVMPPWAGPIARRPRSTVTTHPTVLDREMNVYSIFIQQQFWRSKSFLTYWMWFNFHRTHALKTPQPKYSGARLLH